MLPVYDEDELESYDDYMTGGEIDRSYMEFAG